MEVHHPHHLTHKKKTREYILEFFMLFFAVTLGFFAENIREEITAREREHKYMISFISDLVNDTANFNRKFPSNHQRVLAIDSVLQYYTLHENQNKISGWLYKKMHRASWGSRYMRNTTTINQLKNSGGQIIIHNKAVADSIAALNYLWERKAYYFDTYLEYQNRELSFLEKMENPKDILKFVMGGNGFADYQKVPDNATIRINPDYLNEYLNFLTRQRWTSLQDDSTQINLNQRTIKMIGFIKVAYQLKTE